MIKGERARATIVSIDEEGAGVTGSGLHVAFALPGEEVLAEIDHVSGHVRPHGARAWGRLVEIGRRSPERVEAACVAWGRCGGCALQHWAYPAQLAWKRAHLATALGLDVNAVDETVASPSPLAWRNRSKLVFGRDGERVILGAYAPRSHEVIELAGCALVEAPLDEMGRRIGALATELALPVFEEKSGEGLLRHAILRRNAMGETLLLLVVARAGEPGVAELATRLSSEFPSLAGVVENLHAARSNAIVGREAIDRLLAGRAFLEETIGPVRLRTSARAFAQANRGVAERLYADVAIAAALDGTARALDVYCGVGGIALTLARSAGQVLGVEESEDAITDAQAMAPPHARFIAGDAARVLATLDGAWDAIVLNPPRKGVAPSVIDACLRLAPRSILYVSCNPSTLARDLGRLIAGGYQRERVTPYDMLPHTPHVEALAVLRRRS